MIGLQETSILVNNDAGSLTRVVIEPWGEEVSLRVRDQLHVKGEGPVRGAVLELRYERDTLYIFAWQGSTLTVTLNGEQLVTACRVIKAM